MFPAVTVTVVRDRKIRTALRTNQIAGFVTLPAWIKIRSGRSPLHGASESGYSADKSLCSGKPTITPMDFSKIAEDGQDGARATAHPDNPHELLYTVWEMLFFLHLTPHLG